MTAFVWFGMYRTVFIAKYNATISISLRSKNHAISIYQFYWFLRSTLASKKLRSNVTKTLGNSLTAPAPCSRWRRYQLMILCYRHEAFRAFH